ncbi:hypothetical protein RN001_016400 [Aquatica leii]|uniref:Uncharacterized protein n=1 Tax=Aquatica leii TaxID=1421715 RepID=A0AAN7NZC3_9COLE|nr:hypothetical protein RN001_016400 [Aquatica leii]
MKVIFFFTLAVTLLVKVHAFDGYGYTNNYGFYDDPSLWFGTNQHIGNDISKNKPSAYAYSSTNTNSNSKAQAKSSLTFKTKGMWNVKNALLPTGASTYFTPYNFKNNWIMNPYSNGNNLQGAFATAQMNPQSYQQNAGLFTPYMSSSNLNLIGKPPIGNNYGVYTSSQSVNSNVNGQPVTYQQSSTTVNDNGKINTHTIRYP